MKIIYDYFFIPNSKFYYSKEELSSNSKITSGDFWIIVKSFRINWLANKCKIKLVCNENNLYNCLQIRK